MDNESFDGQRIIGVDNSQFFPADDATRESMLRDGFEALKTHEWLIEGRKLRTHTRRLTLMAAAIASPDASIMLRLPTSDGGQQVVTYYRTAGVDREMIVEQFRTSDGDSLITQLEGSPMMYKRLHQTLQIPETIGQWDHQVTLAVDTFRQAVMCAKTKSPADLNTLLATEDLDTNAGHLADAIYRAKPVGSVEVASLTGREQS